MIVEVPPARAAPAGERDPQLANTRLIACDTLSTALIARE
jgi:hypothetical protein